MNSFIQKLDWAWVMIMLCAVSCDNPSKQRESVQQTRTTSDKESKQGKTNDSDCQAAKELDGLDTRVPVPLQPMMAWHQKQNMMEHLVAIQRITDGLARDNWEEVRQASSLIESSPQMQQSCEHMGAGAPGFTEAALEFHRRADAISLAAKEQDVQATLQATSNTLQSCTGCHATFRQDVVSLNEWQMRTGQNHDPGETHNAK